MIGGEWPLAPSLRLEAPKRDVPKTEPWALMAATRVWLTRSWPCAALTGEALVCERWKWSERGMTESLREELELTEVLGASTMFDLTLWSGAQWRRHLATKRPSNFDEATRDRGDLFVSIA